jgi:hypothetical protein
MKYICLGYIEPGKFDAMTEGERHATFDECFEHNDRLRDNGHLVAEIPLQPSETALTLHWKNGKVATTDGLGPIEIRPVMDLSEIINESERRRGKNTSR